MWLIGSCPIGKVLVFEGYNYDNFMIAHGKECD